MTLFRMSAAGAVLVLVIAIIRAFALNRLPKRAFLAMWAVALVRLLVPYDVPFAFSVYSLAARLVSAARTPVNITTLSDVPFGAAKFTANDIIASDFIVREDSVGAAVSQENWVWLPDNPLVVVWLFGMAVCAVFFAVAYVKCRREFRESLPVADEFPRQWLSTHRIFRRFEVRSSDRMSAPLTYGIFRPVILVPKTFDWNDTESASYMLTHEFVHIRRLDALLKLVLVAAVCAHWFNPAVWVMYILANRDIELACDEAVVNMCGMKRKSSYALALISMEERRGGFLPLCNNFSKNAIEGRIESIMKTKKTSKIALFVAATLVICVAAAFATSEKDIRLKNESCLIVTNSDGRMAFENEPRLLVTNSAGQIVSENDAEAWTAKEFEAWLENERKELQGMVGGKNWTQGTGWFTWTQEMIDDTIGLYERTLQDIRSGVKLSKPRADDNMMSQFGDAFTITGADGSNLIPLLKVDEISVTTVGDSNPLPLADSSVVGDVYLHALRIFVKKSLAEYEKFGLTYDEVTGNMYWHGKLVRYFSAGIDGDSATAHDYANDLGTVCIHVVREATVNADGSVNQSDKLLGIEEYEEGELKGLISFPKMEIIMEKF